MWAEALDRLIARSPQRPRPAGLAAISGSGAAARQRVPDRRPRGDTIARLDPACPLAEQLRGAALASGRVRSGWTRRTAPECAEITAAVGGAATLARHTGSRAFERFTGPQIREFATESPAATPPTDSHPSGQLVHGVAAGRRRRAARPGRRLGYEPDGPRDVRLVEAGAGRHGAGPRGEAAADRGVVVAVGTPSPVLADASRLPSRRRSPSGPATTRAAWSAPGLVREGRLAISLGTSDTVFGR